MMQLNLEAKNSMASVREAMALLDVSRPTLLKWISDGRFPDAAKAEGATGEWSIPRKDIEAVRQELVDDLRRQIEDLEKLAALDYQ